MHALPLWATGVCTLSGRGSSAGAIAGGGGGAEARFGGEGVSGVYIGTLHTDNAGELLSHEFEDFMDDALISHTRCPAHVHQLNGVAERGIRTIMENVRANKVASQAPLGFWPNMVNPCGQLP